VGAGYIRNLASVARSYSRRIFKSTDILVDDSMTPIRLDLVIAI